MTCEPDHPNSPKVLTDRGWPYEYLPRGISPVHYIHSQERSQSSTYISHVNRLTDSTPPSCAHGTARDQDTNTAAHAFRWPSDLTDMPASQPAPCPRRTDDANGGNEGLEGLQESQHPFSSWDGMTSLYRQSQIRLRQARRTSTVVGHVRTCVPGAKCRIPRY